MTNQENRCEKKIPTLFKRNSKNMARVLETVHPDCQWVLDGEGQATLKLDGTCCAVIDGVLYKRREVKLAEDRTKTVMPLGFIEVDHDLATRKAVGWVPVNWNSKEDKWHAEAWDHAGQWRRSRRKILGYLENRLTANPLPAGGYESD